MGAANSYKGVVYGGIVSSEVVVPAILALFVYPKATINVSAREHHYPSFLPGKLLRILCVSRSYSGYFRENIND